MARKKSQNQDDYSRPNCFLRPLTPGRPPHLPHVLATGRPLVVNTSASAHPRGGAVYSNNQGGAIPSTPTRSQTSGNTWVPKWKPGEPTGPPPPYSPPRKPTATHQILAQLQAQALRRVAVPPAILGEENRIGTNRTPITSPTPPPAPPTRRHLPGISFLFRSARKEEAPPEAYRGTDLSRATTLVEGSHSNGTSYPERTTVERYLTSRLPVWASVPREAQPPQQPQRAQQDLIQIYPSGMRQFIANSTATMECIPPGPRPNEIGGRSASPEYDYPPMPKVECKGLYCGTTDQNVRLWNLRNQARLKREEKRNGKRPEQDLESKILKH